MMHVEPRPAPEPGALDGFAVTCDDCGERAGLDGARLIGTSSLESLAREQSAMHARWHLAAPLKGTS